MSLSARMLGGTSLVLVAFLTLTGWALDRGFRSAVEAGIRERLEAQIYMLLGTARLEQPLTRGFLPTDLPEPRFSTPESGLYAQVTDQGDSVIWKSRSLLGRRLPRLPTPRVGQWLFQTVQSDEGLNGFSSQLSVGLDAIERGRRLTFTVVEDRRIFDRQVQGFRQSVFSWLFGLAVALLILQALAMRWGLLPLKRLALDLRQIEAGTAERLESGYPRELMGVTQNLNALLESSRALLTRYRHALGDLAHSLKTPLAVMRETLARPPAEPELTTSLLLQLDRIQKTVDYQLQRAAASGRRHLLSPVKVREVLERVLASLQKVYAERALAFALECPADCGFLGDEGDLFEIAGNLLDNAAKWAHGRVTVVASNVSVAGLRRLCLEVEDDGPGFAGTGLSEWVERGARADTLKDGQGIGLAVVAAIVAAHGGQLESYTGRIDGAAVRVVI